MKKTKKGKSFLNTGPMRAGKTEGDIRMIDSLTVAGKRVLSFKQATDRRWELSTGQTMGEIVSFNCERRPAYKVVEPEEILEIIAKVGKPLHAISIGEIQFFLEVRIARLISVIKQVTSEGTDVYLSGLDKDFRGVDFELTKQVAAYVDKVTVLTASCQVCRQPATLSQRLIDGKPAYANEEVYEVEGAKERTTYEPRCVDCHIVYHGPVPLPTALSRKEMIQSQR